VVSLINTLSNELRSSRSAKIGWSERFSAITEVVLLEVVKQKKASSSIGRAAVSKTAGWGFDSLLACQYRGRIGRTQELASPRDRILNRAANGAPATGTDANQGKVEG
jgi:hypothetical protein